MEKFAALLREYDMVNSAALVGKEVSLISLRNLAKECNAENPRVFKFNVDGSDAELILSIKFVIDASLKKK